MVSAASYFVISQGFLRHRRRRRPHRILDTRSGYSGVSVGKVSRIDEGSMPASRARMERRRKAREATKMLNRVLYMADAESNGTGNAMGETANKLEKLLEDATAKLDNATLEQPQSVDDAEPSYRPRETSRGSAILTALRHMSTDQWQDGPQPLNSRPSSAVQDVFGAAVRRMQGRSDGRAQNELHTAQEQTKKIEDMCMVDPFTSTSLHGRRKNSGVSANSHTQSPKGTMHANTRSQAEEASSLSTTKSSLTESPHLSPLKPSLTTADSAWSASDEHEGRIISDLAKPDVEQVAHSKLSIPYLPPSQGSHQYGYSSGSRLHEMRDSPASEHRRKMSFKFPVKATTSTSVDSSEDSSVQNSAFSEEALSLLEIEERDLEYKHRHTFVGTASLDDFLDRLEFSATYRTVKSTVIKAFVHLASTEQVLARQSSPNPNGWEFVQRTVLDTTPPTSDDYILQSQVRLGIISLQRFLDMIPWDDKDQADTVNVVDAFCAASHLDQTLSRESKARAFRSWMVREKMTKNDCGEMA
ncbi:unnamed protein product [Periconia digitata]|uniref:Uncharacterized protein n=1 Tax=Periconia digitata TaxID=1303443 RepID=A0A9W4XSY9_9PLEO|nr:unnamed protein product [Periconia digitata]